MNLKKYTPHLLIGFSVICIVLSFVLENIQTKSLPSQTIQMGNITFEIVRTPEQLQQGLSERTTIPQDYGMLFVFPEKENYGIWMKDMKEPIDILWLADDGEILKIDANVSPDTYPKSFHPLVPVRYVLEMKAGEASIKGFIVGSKIELPVIVE